jgi:GMP synthase-like glutamine amidotransferase
MITQSRPKVLHLIRHDDVETPGGIATWAAARGFEIREIRFFSGDAPPPASEVGLLVIMGGTMSANDDATLPWLPREKRWISEVIGRGARVLGICLGAQLVANVLGAPVYRNAHREIGWFPVTRSEDAAAEPLANAIPAVHTSFLWHSETFDLPPGAVRLAQSECTPNQGFIWGDRVVAVQFHPEMTVESAREVVAHFAHEITPGPYVQPAESFLAEPERYLVLERVMHGILDRLAGE